MKTTARLLAILACATTFAMAESPDTLRAAAERGDARAQFELARACLRGDGVPKDAGAALRWMEKAAAQEWPDGIGGLGYFHAEGLTIARDDAKAAAQYRAGAEQGSARSQLNYGQFLAVGRGVAKDVTEGLRWIDRAVAQGLPEAQFARAGVSFFGEYGQPIDYRAALVQAQPAADAGHAPAQNMVGVIHRDGVAGKIDLEAAERWMRKAAAQGERRAQSNLGHLLGPTVPDATRRAEALQWLVLAARQNEGSAMRKLDEVRSLVAAPELAAAEQAANVFKPVATAAR